MSKNRNISKEPKKQALLTPKQKRARKKSKIRETAFLVNDRTKTP